MQCTELYTDFRDAIHSIRRYRAFFHKWPNLIRPQTFNEHILRKKLFDRNPLLTQIADKYKVRDYVTERVGEKHLTKLFLVTTNPEEIDFAHLPEQFAVKATHGSGYNFFVTDKNIVDHNELIERSQRWLSTNFYKIGREWCYKHIVPQIIVEELIRDEKGKALTEFKFYCFSGVPTYVSVVKDRFTDFKQDVYDVKWSKLPFKFKGQNFEWHHDRPINLDEMISIAQRLSTGLDFVRVDLYSDGKKILVGELTNYPDNGKKVFNPREYDSIYGKAWATNLSS